MVDKITFFFSLYSELSADTAASNSGYEGRNQGE